MKKYNKKPLRIIKWLEYVILTVLIVSFGVLVYCIYVSIKSDKNYESLAEYKADKTSSEAALNNINEESITDIIENVNKSVVGISKIKNKGTTVFLENSTTSLGLGTGFIVSANGYIVTNEHVSGDKYSTCFVTLENGKTYNGTVVWADSDIDLSIVKIGTDGLDYVTLGNSNNLKVAQNVYAIGNPIGFEFQRTVTSGIISGLNRTLKIEDDDTSYYMEDLIQTDATINPGNSGGPLINEIGEVIGVNSVKVTSAEGIGFASPINILRPIIQHYIDSGNYTQATLGIFAYDKNVIPYINQELSLNLTLDSGVYIAKIKQNSPAEKSGLKEGDIILEIDENSIKKMSELREIIYNKNVGDIINIKYLRNKRENNIDITLEKKQ